MMRPYKVTANPSISLTKTAFAMPGYKSATIVKPGTNIAYKYVVKNTGNINLSVDVVDAKLGSVAKAVLLAPGVSKTYWKSTVITTPTTNTATATGTSQVGVVTAQASTTVNIAQPSIIITKIAYTLPSYAIANKVPSGTKVYYKYVVKNTGNMNLNVNIVDDKLGAIANGVFLSPGASKTYWKSTIITAKTTNIVTVTGIDRFGTSVQASAKFTVSIK